jgi:hypothetical protein
MENEMLQTSLLDKGEFISTLLNGMSPSIYLALLLVAYIGLAINFSIGIAERDKGSKRSPKKFSKKFLWNDNKKRLLQSIGLTPILLLISSNFLGLDSLNIMGALLVGMMADRGMEYFKNIKKRKTAEYNATYTD